MVGTDENRSAVIVKRQQEIEQQELLPFDESLQGGILC